MRLLRGFVLALSAVLFLAGCGGSEGSSSTVEHSGASADAGMEHIHGLGVADGTLYIATHTGLWTAPDGETQVRRFGQSRQDIMGFSIVDEQHFIGSGHPDPSQTNLPPNLGLIESRDQGHTWQDVSLSGQADFHVLQSAGQHLYGVDSATGTLLTSSDGGREWAQRTPPAGVFSLAIDPRAPERIVISTENGVFNSSNAGGGWRSLRNDVAGLLAWPRPNALYLIDGQGTVQVSRDDGQRWETIGTAGGQPAAFIAHRDELYVALADNTVKRSADGGRTWTMRATP